MRHQGIVEQRLDVIAAWLLETREFRRWHGSSTEGGAIHATLFCDGTPGVGKSYLM